MRVSQLKGLWGFPKETKIWPLDCSSTSTRESQPALPDTPPMAPAKLGPQSHSHFLVLNLFTYIYWFLLLWLNPDTHSADYILKTVAGILLHSSSSTLALMDRTTSRDLRQVSSEKPARNWGPQSPWRAESCQQPCGWAWTWILLRPSLEMTTV